MTDNSDAAPAQQPGDASPQDRSRFARELIARLVGDRTLNADVRARVSRFQQTQEWTDVLSEIGVAPGDLLKLRPNTELETLDEDGTTATTATTATTTLFTVTPTSITTVTTTTVFDPVEVAVDPVEVSPKLPEA